MLPLLKLTIVFGGIVLLLSRKWNLGLVLLLASIAIGLLFAYPIPALARDFFLASVDPLTLRLALTVVLIMTLGELLHQTASTKGMVEALQALIPNGRIVIAALPALIGLLPMVGGAMFSAPMVDEVGDSLEASEERKTFINYWFRHIWEPALPLYPAVMLGAALLGLTTVQLTAITWPLSIAAIAGGLLFALLGLPRRSVVDLPSSSRAQSLRMLGASVWPILLVIILSFALPVDERITLAISLLATITLMMLLKRIPLRDLGVILRERIPWNIMAVIFGALVFRRVLENSTAVVAVSDSLTVLNFPLFLVAFGVPFIAGLLTGLMPAGYSIGFPVIVPLITGPDGSIAPAWVMWVMAGGIVGTMLSPVHLCLALTRVYFKAEWRPIYRYLVPSGLLVIALAAAVLMLSSQPPLL